MADPNSSLSPPNPLMNSQSQSNPNPNIASPISNPNPNIASPAIASPSLSDLSQHSQIDTLISPNSFQINQQQLQRSNSAQRVNQMQGLQSNNQQFGGAAMSATNTMRMYAGSGQMSFGGGAQQQQLLSRAGMMGQVGQLPMLPGQTAAHYGLPNQILSQRQKGMMQNTQFNTANVGQALSGMQTMGMMGQMGQMNTLGMNQIRANSPLSYAQQQRYNQLRTQQQISSQTALNSPQKLTGQGLGRASSLGGLPAQQQQLLKQMTPQQQQMYLQQLSQQKHQQQLQQQIQLQQQLQQQQQTLSSSSSPRVVGPTLNRTVSLTSPQQQLESSSNNNNNSSNSNNVAGETGKQILGKRKIQDLVSQVDPIAKVEDEVEDLLLEIADDFIDSVAEFAVKLAKHRKSSTLETKDVLFILEKDWRLTVPGYSKKQKNTVSAADVHKRRMEMVRAMVMSQQVEREQQGVIRGGVQVQMPLMANNNNNNNNNNNRQPVAMSHNEMGNSEHATIRTASIPRF